MGKGIRNSRSDSGGGGNADTCASSPVDHNFSTAKRQVAEQTGPEDPHLPTMIVFDLDFCLWNPEMHELSGMPSVEVEGPLDPDDNFATTPLGCVGLSVPKRRRNGRGRTIPSWELDDGYGGDETVRLFDGARRALRELALKPRYRGIVLACASSSLEPSYSHACLDKLEVLPDLTLREMFTYNQIGRTGKLSPRKTTHFRELHRESGVPYTIICCSLMTVDMAIMSVILRKHWEYRVFVLQMVLLSMSSREDSRNTGESRSNEKGDK